MSTARLAARLSLIVVADAEAIEDHGTLVEIVRASVQAGAPAIQLRGKRLTARAMVEIGRAMLEDTRRADALFFVNDRVDIALAIGADGAHIGADDLPVSAARSIAPAGFLLGRSVESAGEARHAELDGADYLGVGPVFATLSKADAGAPLAPAGVADVVTATQLPVVGIGGIDAGNAGEVVRTGAAGVAVIRAVLAAPDPARAVTELLSLLSRHQPA